MADLLRCDPVGYRRYATGASQIDLPGRFIARKWVLDQPTNELLPDKTLDGLRGKLPQGLARLDRSPQDDPKVIET